MLSTSQPNNTTDQSPNKKPVSPRRITIPPRRAPIQLTRFTGPDNAILTKQFSLDDEGTINKQSQPLFSSGHAETIEIKNQSDIENIANDLKPNQCISTGTFDATECDIVRDEDLTPELQQKGARSRTKEHMSQPDVGLVLLDYDPSPYMPEQLKCGSVTDLMKKTAAVLPDLAKVVYSGTGSCSSGIYKTTSGDKYSDVGGLHVYIGAKNVQPEDLKQYVEVKLWNADYGYIALAKNGAMLPRTLIDLAVMSPERLIFEAPPVLGAGLSKENREWAHQQGTFLTGPFELTAREIAEYEQRLKAAKSDPDTIAKAEALQDAYYKERTAKVAKAKGITQEDAKRLIPRQSLQDREKTEQVLNEADVIEIGTETVTVAELLERGEEFDGKAMPDPIEGSAYGTTTSKFYFNNGQSPRIHSFAHGLKVVYRLPDRERFTVCSTSIIPATPEPLSPESFPHVRQSSSGNVSIPPTIENVRHLIVSYGGTVRYDVISKKLNIRLPGLSGSVDNYDNTAMNRIISLAALNGLPITQIPQYVAVIGDENQINPVADWIASKPWDGNDRLKTIYSTLHTRKDFDEGLKHALMYRWLVGAVAAVMNPSGFHARGVLTLQGPQGIGKTTWIKNSVSDPLLRETTVLLGHHLDPGNKDSVITAVSHWIVEIGELDSSFKKDIAHLKGLLTNNSDRLRRPYARTNSEYPRRTVFCATVNEENFLVDTTGNSRWWTLPLIKIDYNHNIDMQQLFAQVTVDLRHGAQWWLTQREEALLEEHNRDHRSISAIEERVLAILDSEMANEKWTNRSATDVLQTSGIRNPTNPQTRECGKVLREIYGPPKKIRGIMKWRIPLQQQTFTRV
jgi:hypothetical protein